MRSRNSLGILIILALSLLAAAAQAHRAPALQGPRPGPSIYDAAGPDEAFDPIPNGFVNRTSGGVAALVALNAGPYPGGSEAAARAYMKENAASLALTRGGSDLILHSVRRSPAGVHVRFNQGVDGVPVWRADLVVSLDPAAQRVRAVSSGYDPILANTAITTVPVIDAAQARRVAMAGIGIDESARFLGEPAGPALMVARDEDRVGSPARLAWRVLLPVEEPMGDWEVFVDAADGRVIRIVDQMLYADGSGYSFDPDPLTTAGVVYGGQYVDNNDADAAVLNNQRFLVALRDITLISGVYHLRGPWVYLEDFESPTSPPVTSADPHGFAYTRNQQGFEDVMAYYGIDQSQRYMQSLGFDDIQHLPIRVDPHGLSGQDNSHYIPSTNKIAWGEGGVDDAEDMDVILHEYGHAIQNSIVPGWGGSTQARSMGEGFGDYWCGSYSASISDWHSEWVFNWDGHNTFWSGRVLNSTQGYANLNGDIYHDGTIWASCWWLIRGECGRTVTDTDMLALHYYMGTSGTMPQAAGFAMQADKEIYGGLHSGSLDYYFTLRGFWGANQYDVPALTHTPLGDQTTGGPYPITVTIQSGSAIVANSVKVIFGTGSSFDQQATLQPTGNPNEWGGSIPGQGGDVTIRYYIQADNAATWRGAAPRGAEHQFYSFHVEPLMAIEELGGDRAFDLLPASPNPFNPATKIRFDLPSAGAVKLTVHDLEGRRVRTLAEGSLPPGRHAYTWDGRGDGEMPISSGLYFVRLESAGRQISRKILMAK